jgi:hypothetical protein
MTHSRQLQAIAVLLGAAVILVGAPSASIAVPWHGDSQESGDLRGVSAAGTTTSGQNPPPPSSVTLRRGTRAWRSGLVLAKKAWRLNFTTTTGRQVTMVAKSRDATGRRAFVVDIRCDGELIARGFGRRGQRVRLTFKRPPSSCVLRFLSGKQKVKYRAALAVTNR